MKAHLYILRAHLAPFLFSLITLMFVFLLQFLMKAVDQLVGKGLGFWVIGELILLSLAWMVVLAVPASVLVATLMGFGKLSSQNEITALRAGGMSLPKMMATVIAAAAVLGLLTVEFNNRVLPEANHRFKLLMMDIRRIKPTLSINAGLFNQDLSGYSILARTVSEYSSDLGGLTIYDYTDPSMNVVITADRGRVSFTPDYRRVVMDLSDGEIHRFRPSVQGEYRRIDFARHRIAMDAEGFDFERSAENAFSRSDRELSADVMRAIVDSLRAEAAATRELIFEDRPASRGSPGFSRIPAFPIPDSSADLEAARLAAQRVRLQIMNSENRRQTIESLGRQINSYMVEIHKKYAIPAACLVFVFIGVPLGVMARRGTFGVAATLSLGFFLMYWASLIGGEKLGDRGIMPAWLGMWMANIVLGAIGLVLTVRLTKEIPMITLSPDNRLMKLLARLQLLRREEG
ncbi:MAG TPA: LptF/LptG family permease [Bacteroidota bacterium]|nr:LptF/LptG family permease [Bacteroidota bacterium]